MGQPNKIVPLKPRRRSKDPEDLNLDEMWNSPSMKGMLSFLDVTPEERMEMMLRRDAAAHTVADAGIPNLGIPDPPIPTLGVPNPGVPTLPQIAADIDIPNPDITKPGIPISGVPELAPIRIAKPRPLLEARTVQDAQTPTESKILDLLWKHGTRVSEDERWIQIGKRTLIQLASMDRLDQRTMSLSTVQKALATLEDKLALQLKPAQGPRDIRTFVIFSYREILRRRREANKTHFYVVTNAVRLVNPADVPGLPIPVLNSGTPNPGIPELDAGTPRFGTPAANPGIPRFGTQLVNTELQREYTSSTTSNDPPKPLIRRAIHESLNLPVDDEAVQKLSRACCDRVADATEEEIAELTKSRAGYIAAMLRRNANITSPIGILITSVPKDCTPDAIAAIRLRKQQETEQYEQLCREVEGDNFRPE